MIRLGKKRVWLLNKGDRNINDLLCDDEGKEYVLMWSSRDNQYTKVYLPNFN